MPLVAGTASSETLAIQDLRFPKNRGVLRAGFWQNGFLFLSRRIFSRILSPDFLFLWEKVPRKMTRINPRQNPAKFILDNPRPSYRAENPTNPKIGPKYQPDIQIPLTVGDRKKYPENTRKIPRKYDSRIFGLFRGVSEGVFRGISRFVCWGVFLFFVGFPILQVVEGLSSLYNKDPRQISAEGPGQQFVIRDFVPIRSFPFWTILVQHPFLQCRGHSWESHTCQEALKGDILKGDI